ncbi:hypothetical protein EDB85DRAFT_1863314, partial [Lactarius pseudohatsudake]
LTKALQMRNCGFRSVIGTMWAMAGIDGPDFARHFYMPTFYKGIPYCEKSAEALRDAVQKSRRILERWVNLVHEHTTVIVGV